eukprot:140033-Amphidinium_carterae.1
MCEDLCIVSSVAGFVCHVREAPIHLPLGSLPGTTFARTANHKTKAKQKCPSSLRKHMWLHSKSPPKRLCGEWVPKGFCHPQGPKQ